MSSADTLSLAALAVSGLSLAVSVWSAWISHRGLAHTQESSMRERSVAYERERAELLEAINESRSIYDRARLEIGALKATFDAEPEEVRALLVNYTDLFTTHLPRLEHAISQITAAWHEVCTWSPVVGVHVLMHHKARFKATLHEDQVAHDMGLLMVTTFKEKLGLARQVVHARAE